MPSYVGEVKVVGAFEACLNVRIDDLDIEAWQGTAEQPGTAPRAGFTGGYVTVVLLDDTLGRMAGAMVETTGSQALTFAGDGRFV